jgi:hypothetical protein
LSRTTRQEDDIEDFNENETEDESGDSDFENFSKNYESYNAKKLSLFKKKTCKNDLSGDENDCDELNKVD